MKRILDIRFIFIAAVLVVAMACQQTANPATEPSKDVEPAAAQASVDPVEEVETPADPPNIADYMDAATARLFEQMTPEWQEMTRSGWGNITKLAPRSDWAEAAQDIVSQGHAQAKIQGGIRGVPVAGVQDLVDPGKGGTSDGTTPFVLSLLSPEYTEAYDLIPDGSLMREYMDIRLGAFSERGWESIKAQPDEPYPAQAPKLDAGDEFELRRMLTNAGDAEWLVQRLRSLDADAAREYEATNDSTERLAILRKLVEADGKEQGVVEIRAEYGARSNGWDEAKIADYIERTRIWAAEREARSRMTPRQRHINHAESTLCGDLMSHIVGQEGRAANSSPGQCDIAKVITLTKEALKAGQMAISEEELHEAVEFARQTPGRIDTANKGRIGKDELIKRAESMPIFGGGAASTDTPPDADILVSALGFIRVGLDGKNAYDVYPPGVHESCTSPGPGHPSRAAKEELGSPPAPAYLPEGVSLDQESHSPGGAHIGNIYVGKQGANSGVRVTVRHGVCESVTVRAPSDEGDSWELTSVEGNWGIFFHEDGNTILNLTTETESGFVEIRSVDLQAKQRNRIGKGELIKIAESMPIFGGEAVSVAKP